MLLRPYTPANRPAKPSRQLRCASTFSLLPSGNAVNHVSDTALWVAMYRAMETDRPDAVFRDPLARKLAGPRGGRFSAPSPRGGPSPGP